MATNAIPDKITIISEEEALRSGSSVVEETPEPTIKKPVTKVRPGMEQLFSDIKKLGGTIQVSVSVLDDTEGAWVSCGKVEMNTETEDWEDFYTRILSIYGSGEYQFKYVFPDTKEPIEWKRSIRHPHKPSKVLVPRERGSNEEITVLSNQLSGIEERLSNQLAGAGQPGEMEGVRSELSELREGLNELIMGMSRRSVSAEPSAVESPQVAALTQLVNSLAKQFETLSNKLIMKEQADKEEKTKQDYEKRLDDEKKQRAEDKRDWETKFNNLQNAISAPKTNILEEVKSIIELTKPVVPTQGQGITLQTVLNNLPQLINLWNQINPAEKIKEGIALAAGLGGGGGTDEEGKPLSAMEKLKLRGVDILGDIGERIAKNLDPVTLAGLMKTLTGEGGGAAQTTPVLANPEKTQVQEAQEQTQKLVFGSIRGVAGMIKAGQVKEAAQELANKIPPDIGIQIISDLGVWLGIVASADPTLMQNQNEARQVYDEYRILLGLAKSKKPKAEMKTKPETRGKKK